MTGRGPTEVADLELTRLATCEEIGDAKLNSDRLKHLSGGGTVRARRMRQDTREFVATWLLWITTNGLPQTTDNSRAFWRRVVVLNFPNSFDPADEPDLEATLQAELRGILTGIVRGAVEYYREGLGAWPETVREHTREYREDVDPLERLFESGVLVEETGTWTPSTELYTAYQAWASAAGVLMPFGFDGFAKALRGRFQQKRARPAGAGRESNPVRGFVGVKVGAALGGDAA